MPRVTLVSDLEADTDWSAFEQLTALSHLLAESGHQLSLWLSPSSRDADVWPRKATKLSPYPRWSGWDAFKGLPFLVGQSADILHFVPRLAKTEGPKFGDKILSRTSFSTHAFSWLAPLLKGFHNPLIVSSFYSWPDPPAFHIRQLLHLSELVLTPSEHLKNLVSADPYSTAFQSFGRLPLLSGPLSAEESLPRHYEELTPFIYLPGLFEEWEDAVATLEFLSGSSGWKGWIIAGQGWTRDFSASRRLQSLARSPSRIFFPEKMSPALHRSLVKRAEWVWLKGLKLDSLSLSRGFEEGALWERPLFFSEVQSELHSPLWKAVSQRLSLPSDFSADRTGQAEHLLRVLRELQSKAVQSDPASQLNRLYSRGLARRNEAD
jgi:hypothetical protein